MGEDIPEEANIVVVADADDDMTGHWSYREPLPQGTCKRKSKRVRGTPFDSRFAVIMPEAIEEDTGYTMREK